MADCIGLSEEIERNRVSDVQIAGAVPAGLAAPATSQID